MNLAIDRLAINEQEAANIPALLSGWYTAHASIRRLWAVEERDALIVFLALEPTSDGDDMLPAWLANSVRWASDLQSLTRREVRVRLVAAGVLDVGPEVAVIAELDWREAWTSF